MKKNRIMLIMMITVMTISLIFTGCSSQQSDVKKTGHDKQLKETFTVIFAQEPTSLDPQGSSQLAAYAAAIQVHDTLVRKNSSGEIVPGIATKWQVIDETTVRFFLRDDVYFHNGQKLTAEDVRFSIERAATMPLTKSVFKAFDGENTKVVDDYTVDIKLNEPFAAIYNYLAYPRAAIVSKQIITEAGDKYGHNPIGTGPFKFKGWESGTTITLERNDQYWGEKPQYKKLVIKFITEPANRAIEIETGRADAVFDIGTSDIKRLSENENLQVLRGPSFRVTYLGLNMKSENIKDERVRKALAYAIDKKAIVDAVWDGTAQPADSVMPPTIFGYKKMEPIPYDPEKAKQLLKEAGYEKGLVLNIRTTQDPFFSGTAEIVQNMWNRVGVEVKVHVLDRATYLAKGEEGVYEITSSAQTATTGDPDHALFMYHSSAGGAFQGNDPKIDEYLEKGAATYDLEKRQKIYEELQQYLWDSGYCIPIAFPDIFYVIGKNVENFECEPGNLPNLAQVLVYE